MNNEFGQPVGLPLLGWAPPPVPGATALNGGHVRLAALDVSAHSSDLMVALGDAPDALWTYMSFGPFATEDSLRRTLEQLADTDGWQLYAIEVDEKALGFAAYLRIEPANGSIEIGSIVFSPDLQRTTAATESMFLMIDNAFALGYRRCEWKCDALNQPSRDAAERLGFAYEGTFRKATHYKGRNRDTAWYAITDDDWPELRAGFVAWLSVENFDDAGHQRTSLLHPQRATSET